MDEARIIESIRQGHIDAFEEIVEHYQMPMVRYLYRLTGDFAVAQDLAQDTFFQAYRGIDSFNTHISFKAWLYRIATNNARQYYRRKRRIPFIPFSDYGRQAVSAKDSAPERIEQQMAIEESLLEVPYDQRKCMVLHFIEGFKYGEIALIVGISEEAVRKRLARGSRRFRAAYGEMSGGTGE
ncbi:MAG: RNA polymerase sigma factor [Dehalococcoidia bacterium]|nr:RNA polymerase sigma factor [Dehalococcoidia bacterium]